MPPVAYLPKGKSPATPSEYSDAQWRALNSVKQTSPRLVLAAARPEFMNQVMLTDGTISTDLAAVRQACKDAAADDQAALKAFIKDNQARILADDITPEERQALVNLRTAAKHDLLQEFEDHVAEERFLFIVDANLVPRIYYQCAVPNNPDVELATDDQE